MVIDFVYKWYDENCDRVVFDTDQKVYTNYNLDNIPSNNKKIRSMQKKRFTDSFMRIEAKRKRDVGTLRRKLFDDGFKHIIN